jgi:leucyl aminopeptidase
MKIEASKNPKLKYTKIVFSKTKNPKFSEIDSEQILSLPTPEANFDFGLREKIGTIRNIVLESNKHELENLEINIEDLKEFLVGENFAQKAEFLTTNLLMANYTFDLFKSKQKKTYFGVNLIYISGVEKAEAKSFESGVQKGILIGQEVNNCRDLANSPANIIYPESLAQHAKESVKNIKGVSLKVLGQKDLEKIKAGGILAVGKGSVHEPKLIILEYFGNKAKIKESNCDICLIGKGVTHDNGGINLKPSSGGSLEEMHLDMSGGAAVIHTFSALAKLKVNKNIVAIIPAVENSVSGESFRPGDIITMLSGKTVEVLNTDAEGRVILGDALTYCEKYKPEVIIDVATLTGAALIALGTGASAIMGTGRNLIDNLVEIGNNKTGDFLWELPMWNVYKKAVKNKRADIGNIPESNSRLAGSINGGMFLKEFISENQKWAHIDMAPRMIASEEDKLSPGAMGETVRLLVNFSINF